MRSRLISLSPTSHLPAALQHDRSGEVLAWPVRFLIGTASVAVKVAHSRDIPCSTLASSRNAGRCPPFQALRETLALPSGVLGPVDRSDGFRLRLSAQLRARYSDVQSALGALAVNRRAILTRQTG